MKPKLPWSWRFYRRWTAKGRAIQRLAAEQKIELSAAVALIELIESSTFELARQMIDEARKQAERDAMLRASSSYAPSRPDNDKPSGARLSYQR